MHLHSLIVLGGKSNNKRGDLFASAMTSLFSVLGYQDFRLNIHKTGREIDIEGEHSTEERRLIAECKATAEPVGGKEINAFMGKVDVERHKCSKPLQPYFVSLSGFTESAVEQETEANKRVILLDSTAAIAHLVKSKILVNMACGAEKSGRLVRPDRALTLRDGCHLLISEFGNLWLFLYHEHNNTVAYSLIHADGSHISASLATEIARDAGLKAIVRGLEYLAPLSASDQTAQATAVRKRYISYLAKVCGEIQLDGLPADQEVGSRRLKLESLFVPIKLTPIATNETQPGPGATASKNQGSLPFTDIDPHHSPAIPVGAILETENRLAVLGLPGSGKSTLIKRLATAYAFPARKSQVADHLPDRKWLPIFLRCRQLGGYVRQPILSILNEIRARAEIEESQAAVFESMIVESVKGGRALLLVDGLDEISDESDRVSFVNQLRLFLAQYPAVSLVITSRIAGFRVIGNALSSECRHFTLAPFDREDITKLTVAWHSVVVGNRREVLEAATHLATTISSNSRLLKLAENPLLLTTLLLVKRWVTLLPTKRSVLYGRAIEVLLMTWNVEGHQPLDPDEVIPQLAYVALQMMKSGVQRIAQDDLRRELVNARRSMPELLAFAKTNIPDFVSGVELRSSLLLLSGHELRNGEIQPIYEFRHLLFQEYLAAKAISESYLPNGAHQNIEEILRPYLSDDSWEEVTILSASLGGRRSSSLIREITIAVRTGDAGKAEATERLRNVLAQCLADEVPLASPALDDALVEVIPAHLIDDLETSRYAERFRQVCSREFWSGRRFRLLSSGLHMAEIDYLSLQASKDAPVDLVEALLQNVSKTDYHEAIESLFCSAIAAYSAFARPRRAGRAIVIEAEAIEPASEKLLRLGDRISEFVWNDDSHAQVGSCWALAWLGQRKFWSMDRNQAITGRLFDLWVSARDADVRFLSAWAIAALPIKNESKWEEINFQNATAVAARATTVLNNSSTDVMDRQVGAALLYKLYTHTLGEDPKTYRNALSRQRLHRDLEYHPLVAQHLRMRDPSEGNTTPVTRRGRTRASKKNSRN